MISRKKAIFIRKSHRYLGLFIGIQFILWTVSGLYFSWTDIDEIHGDQFKKEVKAPAFTNLSAFNGLVPNLPITSLTLRAIGKEPYYWVNDSILVNANNGEIKNQITEDEALQIAQSYLLDDLKVKSIELVKEADKHHEYRGRPLPVYVISYAHPEEIKAYVSVKEGIFQRVRHRAWRWFDFLWMTHTMDYDGRDNINNIILRVFSLLGLITVLSGFLLWAISSPTLRKLNRKKT